VRECVSAGVRECGSAGVRAAGESRESLGCEHVLPAVPYVQYRDVIVVDGEEHPVRPHDAVADLF
jgi:hypothetical protein